MSRNEELAGILEEVMFLKRRMAHDMPGRDSCGISPAQRGVLMFLHHSSGIGITELATKLGVSKSAATQLVEGLVESGHILREVNSEDRRSVRLRLSEKSVTQFRTIRDNQLGHFGTLFAALDDSELAALRNLLTKVAHDTKEKE
jgi:DNA-binding MarR family transcriptional regulator